MDSVWTSVYMWFAHMGRRRDVGNTGLYMCVCVCVCVCAYTVRATLEVSVNHLNALKTNTVSVVITGHTK